MSPKSTVLAAVALAVVASAVYLFIQVRATPAQASATHVNGPAPEARQVPSRPEPASPPTASEVAVKAEATPPAARPTQPQLGREVNGPPPPTIPDEHKINQKLDGMMDLANKAYDTQDFDQATAIAAKVLTKEPNNVRMLRIMVSANCIGGDSAIAQQHYEKLPKHDREQMRDRCDRYGVSFKEPAE